MFLKPFVNSQKKEESTTSWPLDIQTSNRLFEREPLYHSLRELLTDFERKCKQVSFKKGIYLYGAPGSGKTTFLFALLNSMNYDVISYDAGDARNKVLIESIASSNMSNRNVIHMMEKKTKKIAIVMDEIDGMNGSDKGGINTLIKLIRQKKTKKQKLECKTSIPIVCIGNYHMDKKIKELMKVCHVFELKAPTHMQIEKLLHYKFINVGYDTELEGCLKDKIMQYIQFDLRKIEFIGKLVQSGYTLPLIEDFLDNVFVKNSNYNDSKKTVHKLFQTHVKINEHEQYVPDTERNIVSLLYHENIHDYLKAISSDSEEDPKNQLYFKIIQNFCFADFMERVTFQTQAGTFNEISFLVKTIYNNHLLHSQFPECAYHCPAVENVRFTKLLTKYSTEHNNQQFVCSMCQELKMDKKDMFSFFIHMRNTHKYLSENELINIIFERVQATNITKLDIKRIYRFLDRNMKQEHSNTSEDDEDEYYDNLTMAAEEEEE